MDDFLYALSANMPTLPKNQAPLSLALRGRSLRPVCHFALQESPDYLQRRQSHLLANDLGQQASQKYTIFKLTRNNTNDRGDLHRSEVSCTT